MMLTRPVFPFAGRIRSAIPVGVYRDGVHQWTTLATSTESGFTVDFDAAEKKRVANCAAGGWVAVRDLDAISIQALIYTPEGWADPALIKADQTVSYLGVAGELCVASARYGALRSAETLSASLESFVALGGDAACLVDLLYLEILGRYADPPGMASTIGEMSSCRAEAIRGVLIRLFTSGEFAARKTGLVDSFVGSLPHLLRIAPCFRHSIWTSDAATRCSVEDRGGSHEPNGVKFLSGWHGWDASTSPPHQWMADCGVILVEADDNSPRAVELVLSDVSFHPHLKCAALTGDLIDFHQEGGRVIAIVRAASAEAPVILEFVAASTEVPPGDGRCLSIAIRSCSVQPAAALVLTARPDDAVAPAAPDQKASEGPATPGIRLVSGWYGWDMSTPTPHQWMAESGILHVEPRDLSVQEVEFVLSDVSYPPGLECRVLSGELLEFRQDGRRVTAVVRGKVADRQIELELRSDAVHVVEGDGRRLSIAIESCTTRPAPGWTSEADLSAPSAPPSPKLTRRWKRKAKATGGADVPDLTDGSTLEAERELPSEAA
jgi:hypothetical protein